MRHILVALEPGTEPLAPLPPAAFHRTLEEPIYCPKCEATYYLTADYDWVTSRHFDEESRRHISMLKKAIFLEHGTNHRTKHFETNGVVIVRHQKPREEPLNILEMKPLNRRPI
ncbi:MAG: hypothetical protein PW792_12505 [Acidobacteriaceae bacterium]|nr:hypothetical protein [Acidobacteriaceae bacterium]